MCHQRYALLIIVVHHAQHGTEYFRLLIGHEYGVKDEWMGCQFGEPPTETHIPPVALQTFINGARVLRKLDGTVVILTHALG